MVSQSEETPTERWRRRTAILDVLNPGRAIEYAHMDYAVDLAVKYRWNVKAAPSELTRASHATRTISTPPIYGDEEFAVFCHEGGHVQDADNAKHGGVSFKSDGIQWRESLAAEFTAWRIAMKLVGGRWNKAMTVRMEQALRTYQPGHVKSYQDLMALEAVLAEGEELARHVVRLPTTTALRNCRAR